MKVYHRTYNARPILDEGFRDSTGNYLTLNEYTGVWFSDVPLDCNEGADGDTVLTVVMPDDVFRRFEWIEDGKPYREALIPAEIANQYGPPRIHEDDWEGQTEEDILRYADDLERYSPDEVKHLRGEKLAFLKKHGLLVGSLDD